MLQTFLSAFVIVGLPITLSRISIKILEDEKISWHKVLALYMSIISFFIVLFTAPIFVYLKVYLDGFIAGYTEAANTKPLLYVFIRNTVPFLLLGYAFIPIPSLYKCIGSFRIRNENKLILNLLILGSYFGIIFTQLMDMYFYAV